MEVLNFILTVFIFVVIVVDTILFLYSKSKVRKIAQQKFEECAGLVDALVDIANIFSNIIQEDVNDAFTFLYNTKSNQLIDDYLVFAKTLDEDVQLFDKIETTDVSTYGLIFMLRYRYMLCITLKIIHKYDLEVDADKKKVWTDALYQFDKLRGIKC